jgi:type IV secretory pathway TrbF-like protein
MSTNGTAFSPPAALHPPGALNLDNVLQEGKNREKELLRGIKNLWYVVGGLILAVIVLAFVVRGTVNNIKVLPYVVQIEPDGHVKAVGVIPQAWRGDTTPPIEAALREWVYRMRRVGTDQVLLKEQMEQAGAFMTAKAHAMAKAHWLQVDEMVKKSYTTMIDLGVLLPLTSDFRAVEIEWTERVYNQQGLLLPAESGVWKAIINVAVVPVTDVKTQRKVRNILGIFVTDFSWIRKSGLK